MSEDKIFIVFNGDDNMNRTIMEGLRFDGGRGATSSARGTRLESWSRWVFRRVERSDITVNLRPISVWGRL